ncbi:steroid reductase DET2 isoform X1 [Iris pallida]|uniref:Steroid 5-alpha-reductase DET2 n=1 Tax=Iris pallida TaxID=29817 RepID=A0AAX6FDX6_IRIPA|nr:steroid reductase DET2 isoform X1 [Iris pallida]
MSMAEDSSGDGGSSSSSSLFWVALVSMFVMCPLTALPLQFVAAPYGKHLRSGWGVTLPSPLAWFLMESPSLCLPIVLLLLFHHHHHHSPPFLHLLTISLFLIHYAHRTIIYPLRLLFTTATTTKGVPLSIVLMAFCFNLHNAYLQTQSSISGSTSGGGGGVGLWIWWFRIAVGTGIFFWGMAVNITSDLALLRLKEEGGGGYKIPRGGWFEHVCSPNYMGEVVEWLGYAVVAWSPAALAFFLYTCSNLVPRARANLRWYREKFKDDYPASTKAIIPFLF